MHYIHVMNYKTPAEQAAEIRATLKKTHGWNGRQVSVTAQVFSMGSSITVKIKDPTVPIKVVEAVAKEAEKIDRCEITGDILSGGNRYVHVNYTSEAEKVIMAPWVEAVKAAIASVTPGSNSLAKVEGTEFLVGYRNQWCTSLWANGGHLRDGNVEEIAFAIGRMTMGAERSWKAA